MNDVPRGFHRHSNGGGLVQDTAYVAATAFIDYNAQVTGNAWVTGNARVTGDARVTGYAQVTGDARVTSGTIYGVMRSDSYCFTAVLCADGQKRVIAGCRYFTLPEAREHWQRTRGGTPLGNETTAILDYFVATGQL